MSSEFTNPYFPFKLQKAQLPICKKRQKQMLRDDLQNFKTVYLFSYKDMRKDIVNGIVDIPQWRESKIWCGKNKIVHGTLQSLPTFKIYWPDIEQLSYAIKGQTGLLLTNLKERKVKQFFNLFSIWDYPHPGYEVDVTITLRKGPLSQFQPVIEPYLRKLGMPTILENGYVMLTEDFEVCRAGSILTSEQVHFLQLLGEKLTVYKMRIFAKWTKNRGFFTLDHLEESEGEEELESEYE